MLIGVGVDGCGPRLARTVAGVRKEGDRARERGVLGGGIPIESDRGTLESQLACRGDTWHSDAHMRLESVSDHGGVHDDWLVGEQKPELGCMATLGGDVEDCDRLPMSKHAEIVLRE